jgi:hypothetical protein
MRLFLVFGCFLAAAYLIGQTRYGGQSSQAFQSGYFDPR